MKRVFLSPSSQEHNAYAGQSTTEEIVCNAIAAKVGLILTAHGVAVGFNSPHDGPAGHVARCKAFGADLCICLHTNAGGGQGTEAFCYNPLDLNSLGTKVTKNVYARIAKLTPTADRGIKQNRVFYEIINNSCPVAYFEYEFHDRADLAKWIISHVDDLAEQTAAGILEELGIPLEINLRKAKVTANSLNIRSQPSLLGSIVGSYTGGAIITVLETSNGWGRTVRGWISLKYVVYL